jgi:hypothetical protein
LFAFEPSGEDMQELAALDAGTRIGSDPATFVRP